MEENNIVKDGRLLQDLILLQIAQTKQLLEIKQMLESLIKQEQPKEQKPKAWEKFL